MNSHKLFTIVILVITSFLFSTNTFAFNVSDYGLLPNVRSVSISPDGKHYALIKSNAAGTGDDFLIIDIEKKKVIGGADASKVKAKSVYFATNDHVILRTSTTERSRRIRGKWEQRNSIIYNIKTKKMHSLLKNVKDIYIAQGGFGRIVGINKKENVIYVPAYVGEVSPAYSLFKVNLDNGRGIRISRGHNDVIDWFIDNNGNILAREEYNQKSNKHEVKVMIDGKWKPIYTNVAEIREINIVAVSENNDKLIYNGSNGNTDAIFSMSLSDGAIEGPLYEKKGTDIDRVLTKGFKRKFNGILYSGFLPNYEYTNPETQNILAALQNLFPSSAVSLASTNKGNSKVILRVSGNQGTNDYYVFDADKNTLTLISSGYPNVEKEEIAKIKVIKYKARDGLKISAIVTEPVGIIEKKSLPMIVLPHGGPESYDNMAFDWMAQFFARKGYLVLQPNFRGSTGFGYDFRDAGRGKWGKEMQHDISDGVAAMIKAGHADPDRICIIGASYGGYAALAGGAFTPDLYKCVVSIAGVSDLPRMLASEQRDHGRNHWVVSYWNKVIGNSKTERQKLREISPINSAQHFTAPLLMLHGKDDTVVPVDQNESCWKGR